MIESIPNYLDNRSQIQVYRIKKPRSIILHSIIELLIITLYYLHTKSLMVLLFKTRVIVQSIFPVLFLFKIFHKVTLPLTLPEPVSFNIPEFISLVRLLAPSGSLFDLTSTAKLTLPVFFTLASPLATFELPTLLPP